MNIRGTDFIYYQTSDFDRAVEFYSDILGLQLLGRFDDIKWAEFAAGNITFALNDPSVFDANFKAQSGGAAVAFAVEDVEETLAELQQKGVSATIPFQNTSVCHFACIADPDGNTVWLHQRKDGTYGD